MSDRWLDWCRRRVPEPERTRLFEPALADLERDWSGGQVSWLRRRVMLAGLALQCRRLAFVAGAGTTRAAMTERLRHRVSDVRLALRRLLRQPMFTLTAVLTLALGMGANLAAAAYVYSFLLAPVNAPDSGQLVRVVRSSPEGATTRVVSWPLYIDARDGADGVDLAAQATATAQIGPAGTADKRTVGLVSGNYFRVLQIAPSLGRLIMPADDVAELASPVVVLSDAFWRARFDADPGVVGRTVLINGTSFDIVGVAARGFRGDLRSRSVDAWVPLTMQQRVRPRGLTIDNRNWGWLALIGRRDHDVSLDETQHRFVAVAADVNGRFPPPEEGQAVRLLVSEASALPASERALITPLLAAVLAFTGLLFLVACANLAGIMQARLLARRRELAIRQSLGAGRRRVLSEWVAECLVLAAAGGALGLLAARGVVSGLAGLRPPEQLVGDLSFAAGFDWRLALWAFALSVLAALLFGAVPAWRMGHRPPIAWLRDGSPATTGGRAILRLRRAIVVGQLALAGVLLISATVLVRSLSNQQTFDPGFDAAHLGLLSFDLRRQQVPEHEWRAVIERALDRIRRDPAVVAADLGQSVPLGFDSDARGFRIPGYTPPGDRDWVVIDFNTVGTDYFRALGVPLLAGSGWSASPTQDPPPVVINETMARRFWPDRSPIGAPLEIVGGPTARVTGVVADVAYYEVGATPIPYVYVPAELVPVSRFTVHVRTDGDPAPVVGRLSRAVAALDDRLAADEVLTFQQLRRIPLFPIQLLATSATVFGGLAVLLASVGLYGAVMMSVSQRTREIGVRMALGARPATVLRGVVREALVLGTVGLALALAGGYAASAALQAWLFQISRFDAVASTLVAALLLLLAVLASWIPARRAARVDPVIALRQG